MRTFRRTARLTPLLLLAVATTACLQGDVRHTLYLAPDGSAVWTAMEDGVRSDKPDPASRAAEERQYLVAAGNGQQPVALGLFALDASDVHTRILRGGRPAIVMTDARFDRIDLLADAILRELRLTGAAQLVRSDQRMTLTVHVVLSDEAAGDSGDSPAMALLEDLDHYRIVLTDGAFVTAEGFALQAEGTVAVPIARDDDAIRAQGGAVDLSLAWPVPAGTRP